MSPRDSFPSVPQAALLLLASFLLQYLVGVALYDFRHVLDLSRNQLHALVMLLANGILLSAVMHHRGMTHGDLMHPARSSAAVTFALLVPPVLLLVPAILLFDDGLGYVLEQLLPLSRWEEEAFASMVAGNLPAVVSTCLLAPVLEEMLFRGVLLRAFLERYPRWPAIAISALYFGVAHLNIDQFMLAFLLGLLLGWLFERSRSLIPCIALHVGVNSSVVALELTRDLAPTDQLADLPTAMLLLFVAMAAVGASWLHRLLSDRRSGAPENVA